MSEAGKLLMWVSAGLLLGIMLGLLLQSQAPGAPYQAPAAQPAQPRLDAPGNLSHPQAGQASQTNVTPGTTAGAGANATASLTIIRAPSCDLCTGGDSLAEDVSMILAGEGVAALPPRNLSSSQPEAKALMAKYAITSLPALIVTGNVSSRLVSDWAGVGTVEGDGALVSRIAYPPYYNVTSGRLEGVVEAVAIGASGCAECMNASIFLTRLEEDPRIMMALAKKTELMDSDAEAAALIAKYKIASLPALLLSPGAAAYPFFMSSILPDCSLEGDGWYVLRTVYPPYLNLSAGRAVRGIVDVIYLDNSSCESCLNLSGFGTEMIVTGNISTYDINSTEGRALAAKYGIKKIPTVVYSPEIAVYPGFSEFWLAANNTIESDGWFVFRNLESTGEQFQALN